MFVAQKGQRDGDIENVLVEERNQVVFLAHDSVGYYMFVDADRRRFGCIGIGFSNRHDTFQHRLPRDGLHILLYRFQS